MVLRRGVDAEDDEEQGTISADASDDDLHPRNLDDLKVALATFPFCNVRELILALRDNRDAAPALLEDSLISYQILTAFECVLEAHDLDALSPIIDLCAVLFPIEWSKNAEFTQDASSLIVQLLQFEHAVLGEPWHDALDALCSAITSNKIEHEEIIRCAIASQIQFLADASFDDRISAFKFLKAILNHPRARFNDCDHQMMAAFVEELVSEEPETQ
jgi:hypothetical protein